MDLVDTTEIANRLGVKPETVHMWRFRDLGFPEPTYSFAIGPVWEWEVVDMWARDTKRITEG